jgi:hypothetical protein
MESLFKFKTNRIALLISVFTFPVLLLLMWVNNTQYILNTLILMLIEVFFIYRLVNRLSNTLKINLGFISIVFAIKILLSLFIVYAGWVPMLDIQAVNYGYDPQRYYFQAYELFMNGFNIKDIAHINYTGIIYYYSLIFGLFGHNPIMPILINSFTTLITCLYLIKIIKFAFPDMKNVKLIGLFMLIPEIIWYDILSSRESVCMALITVIIYKLIEMLFVDRCFKIKSFIVFLLCLIMLGVIRTSLIIPVVIIFLAYWLLVNYKNNNKGIGFILIFIILILLFFIPKITSEIGSYDYSFESVIDRVTTNRVDGDSNLVWSNNSIGRLLVVDNVYEIILLTPIRILVYLIAPLPAINTNINELVRGNWVDWQSLMTILSAIFYTFSIVNIFAAIFDYIKKKDKEKFIAIFLPFLVLMLTISIGTQIIHERYRIIAVPFIVAVIFVGKKSSKSSRKLGLFLWLLMMLCFIGAYTILKLL